MSTPQPNRCKHPIVKAFQSAEYGDDGAPSGASAINRKLSELSWRQAHSHDEFYPFESNVSSGTLSLLVKQRQCGEVDGLGTGCVVWNASHVLCCYLTKQQRLGNNLLLDRSLIELGECFHFI